jgi:signal transduction histidine kinase
VAHDFDNLLTTVLAVSELMLAELPGDDPHQADIVEIRDAGQRGAVLTRQLLTFSRQQAFEPREVDPGAIVDGVATMLRRAIGEDVTPVLRRPDAPLPVRADLLQAEQVLLNLAVNTRDAMPAGGCLEIALDEVDLGPESLADWPRGRPGRFARLTVRDTGHGMDERTLRRAFEPCFTTKEPGRGIGLGLSTVYGVAQQTGGACGPRARRAPGRGAGPADPGPRGRPGPGPRHQQAGAVHRGALPRRRAAERDGRRPVHHAAAHQAGRLVHLRVHRD